MSTCEARLLQLQQLLDVKLNEAEILGDQMSDRQIALYELEQLERRGFSVYLLIGSLLEILLFGILIMQIWAHHKHSSCDGPLLKLAAWASFWGSFVLTIAIFSDSWYRFIWDYVSIIQDSMIPSSEVALVTIALLGLISQLFFAWRIHELSGKRWCQALIYCLAALQFAMFVVVNIRYMAARPAPGQYDFINTPSLASSWIRDRSTPIRMAATVACDLTITVAMVIILYPELKNAAFGQRWPKLGRILKLTFEMGILTTISAIVMTGLLFSKTPITQYKRFILFYPSGVLYSSWLLVSLSARASVMIQASAEVEAAGPKSTTVGDIRFRTNTTQRTELTVTILTSVEGSDGAAESSVEPSNERPAPPLTGVGPS